MCPHGLFVHVEREGEKEREGEGGEREKLSGVSCVSYKDSNHIRAPQFFLSSLLMGPSSKYSPPVG